MVLANMTFEIWRKARSKVREGGRCTRWKKRGGIEHGEEGVEEEREKRKKGKVLFPARISLAGDSLSIFAAFIVQSL